MRVDPLTRVLAAGEQFNKIPTMRITTSLAPRGSEELGKNSDPSAESVIRGTRTNGRKGAPRHTSRGEKASVY